MVRFGIQRFAVMLLFGASLALAGCALKFDDGCEKDSDCFSDELCGTDAECIRRDEVFKGTAGFNEDDEMLLSQNLRLELPFTPLSAVGAGIVDIGFCKDVIGSIARLTEPNMEVCQGAWMFRLEATRDGKGVSGHFYRHSTGDDELTDRSESVSLQWNATYTLIMDRKGERDLGCSLRGPDGTILKTWTTESDETVLYTELVLANLATRPATEELSISIALHDYNLTVNGKQVAGNNFAKALLSSESKWCSAMPNNMLRIDPRGSRAIVSFSSLFRQALYSCISRRCSPDVATCNHYESPVVPASG